jgi:hypothetical protein
MSMKVTIEDAGLGDEPIVYEYDTAEVSVEAHGYPSGAKRGALGYVTMGGEIIVKFRLKPPSRPVATAAVASQTTHDEA